MLLQVAAVDSSTQEEVLSIGIHLFANIQCCVGQILSSVLRLLQSLTETVISETSVSKGGESFLVVHR